MLDPVSKCPYCNVTPDLKEHYMVVVGHHFSGVECPKCKLASMHFSMQQGINMWEEMCQMHKEGELEDWPEDE